MTGYKLKITPNGDVYKYNDFIFRYLDNGGAILLNTNFEIIAPEHKKNKELFIKTIEKFREIKDKSIYLFA